MAKSFTRGMNKTAAGHDAATLVRLPQPDPAEHTHPRNPLDRMRSWSGGQVLSRQFEGLDDIEHALAVAGGFGPAGHFLQRGGHIRP